MQKNADDNQERVRQSATETPGTSRKSAGAIVGRILLHVAFLVVAVVALVVYEHLTLQGQSVASLASLMVAAGFGFAPLRALARELFAIEGKLLHLLHGLGGLALGGLALGGVFSGGPLLTHAALAPFAIMGAAQAVMHQDHPRSPDEAAALRRFVTSLPEVEQIANTGNLNSPANVKRAIAVLTDLVNKAQILGEAELQSDPGFQGALRQVTTRFGLSLGLDSVDQAIAVLSKNPAAASALPELRNRLAGARKTIGGS
jgi:hypothetical protein